MNHITDIFQNTKIRVPNISITQLMSKFQHLRRL